MASFDQEWVELPVSAHLIRDMEQYIISRKFKDPVGRFKTEYKISEDGKTQARFALKKFYEAEFKGASPSIAIETKEWHHISPLTLKPKEVEEGLGYLCRLAKIQAPVFQKPKNGIYRIGIHRIGDLYKNIARHVLEHIQPDYGRIENEYARWVWEHFLRKMNSEIWDKYYVEVVLWTT